MRKEFALLMVFALAAGCSGTRSAGGSAGNTAARKPPTFALPGVPLKEDLPQAAEPAAEEAAPAPAAEAAPAETAPAAAAAPAEAAPAPVPAEAKPAAGAESEKELAFHLRSARRYAARKQYRSAAAEYGASLGFIPEGDARAVHALERQGAMVLRAGDAAKAQEYFQAAINKANGMKASGRDVANAYLGLGYCQEQAKKIPEALASYEKALDFSTSPNVKAKIAKTISDLKKAP